MDLFPFVVGESWDTLWLEPMKKLVVFQNFVVIVRQPYGLQCI